MLEAGNFWGAVVAAGLMATSAFANNLSPNPCPTASLASYEVDYSSPTVGAPDGPCSNGILNFSDFTFSSSGAPAGLLLSSSQITLTPDGPPLGEEGDTGFDISGMSIGSGETATYVIDWFFNIDAGPIAGGASLGMDPPFGDVTITQEYCVDSYLSAYGIAGSPFCYGGSGATQPSVQSLSVTSTPGDESASILFNPVAYDFADVRTIIELNGTEGPGGFDNTTGGSTILAPEPAAFLLIPVPLLIAFLRRRRALAL